MSDKVGSFGGSEATELKDIVVSYKVDSNKLREIIDKQVGDAMERWVRDALIGYKNPIRDAFTTRLSEVLVPAIESYNLDNARLEVLLEKLIEESAVGERARLLENFGHLAAGERRDVIPATEILDAYAKYAAQEYDCDGRKVEYEDEPHYAYLSCGIELEVLDPGYHSCRKDASLRLYVEDCDEEQEETICRTLRLWRWDDYPKDPNLWLASYPPQPTFRAIATASSFDIFLARLETGGTNILWDVKHGLSDWVDVEPDSKPECTWE